MVEIAVEKTTTPKTRPAEGSYGFGKYFTDHIFTIDYSQLLGWHAPRITPYQSLRIDPGAAVLHYGQAIFEGLKAYQGIDGRIRLFRPEMNWQRMKDSAERLCMQMVDLPIFIEGLRRLVLTDIDWVPRSPGTALYLRPTLIGTEAFLGVRPSDHYTYFVMASPVGAYYGGSGIEPIKIWVEREYSRAAPGGIGAAKAGGNYAASLKAATEAKKRGFAQVLWLDASDKRFIEEVGTMNVFFVIHDRVITPSLSGTILPGVTRDSVIHLLRESGVTVEERAIELEEVLAANKSGALKEVFGTGTAASISPVGAFGVDEEFVVIGDGRIGALSRQLYEQLNGIQYGRQPDVHGWTMEIASTPRVNN